MPLEDWIQHSWIQHWRLVLYHWQTLAAGILALLAAWRTIRATNREIETTLRLERRRAAREGYAFHAMLEAAMGRVLAEATEAARIFASANQQSDVSSTTAHKPDRVSPRARLTNCAARVSSTAAT
jgi:adenine-specific DNA methylase